MHKNHELYLAKVQTTYGTEEALSATDYLEVLDSSSLSITPVSDPVVTVAGTLQNQNSDVVGFMNGECQLDLPVCGGVTPHWVRMATAAGLSVATEGTGTEIKYTLTPTDVCSDATIWKVSQDRRNSKSIIRKMKNVMFDWKMGSDIGKMATFSLTGKGAVSALPTTAGSIYSITKPANYIPAVLTSTKTFLGSTEYKLVKWEVTCGNVVEQEIDASESYGYGMTEITDRKTLFNFTVYQDTPDVVDPWTALTGSSGGNIVLTFGKANEKITFTGTNARIRDIQESTQGNLTSWDITGYFLDNAVEICVNSDLE